MLRRTAGLAVLTLVVAGCAQTAVPSPVDPAATPTPTPSVTGDDRLVGTGLVLDDGSGPELCLGVIMRSYPPQCRGLTLVGWRWPERGVVRSGDTTWGDFTVVGTWDGARFHVEKATAWEPGSQVPEPETDFSSPCPEPPGGWRALDPARATHETQSAAIRTAEQLPDYGRLWIDDLGDTAQNPAKIVLNVAVTEDPARAERAVREVYGGALCVSRATHTQAELRPIVRDVEDTPGFLGAGSGRGWIDLDLVFDDGTLQRELDEKYGPDLVRVTSALRPNSE